MVTAAVNPPAANAAAGQADTAGTEAAAEVTAAAGDDLPDDGNNAWADITVAIPCNSPESHLGDSDNDEDELKNLSRSDLESVGKGIVDTGATHSMGSIPALEILYKLREGNGMDVSLGTKLNFKFGHGGKEQSSSTTDVDFSLDDLKAPIKLHGLDTAGK